MPYANPEEQKAYFHRRSQTEAYKSSQLKTHYGIDLDRYKEILTTQDGRCAVCGGLPSGKYFDVDHDHLSGQVRGLLCNRCNLMVGWIEKHLGVLQAVLKYLRRYGVINDEETDE